MSFSHAFHADFSSGKHTFLNLSFQASQALGGICLLYDFSQNSPDSDLLPFESKADFPDVLFAPEALESLGHLWSDLLHHPQPRRDSDFLDVMPKPEIRRIARLLCRGCIPHHTAVDYFHMAFLCAIGHLHEHPDDESSRVWVRALGGWLRLMTLDPREKDEMTSLALAKRD